MRTIKEFFHANKTRSSLERVYGDDARKVIQPEIARRMNELKEANQDRVVSYTVLETRHKGSTWLVQFEIQ